ncbi:MAG: response regulator [Gammaproteobacteria bacterium]|nr:response regulator [Gammaproteobacteria bacterium]MBU1555031.1 response regulator [Gammaproteobacteria bacterium]MBU2069086.1 response regulator [Gammaproteobacteria bacterium]MBU2182659.1 response regulator [Gammaproteobacteria bacterium]MBU2206586.1 response regulator [Gammaproteobacteria bacterium]
MSKLLFIDDDAFILRAYQRMLRGTAYQGFYLQQPEQLWQQAYLDSVQIALVDQQMPRISGTELLLQLQHDYPAIQRVLISGDLQLALSQQATVLTLHASLTKPCSKVALLDCLQRLSGGLIANT